MEQIIEILLEDTLNVEELVSTGERELLHGQFSKGMETFAIAEKSMNGLQPDLYFRMGLALFEYGSEEGSEHALILANKKLKQASRLLPESTEILQVWGNTLTLLGQRTEEHHYFLTAKEKYELALSLGEESSDLFSDYAIIWHKLARHSGEAHDYRKSLQFFQKAADRREELSTNFWTDYAQVTLALASILCDPREVIRAINCLKHATALDNSSFDSIYRLAQALEILYDYRHEDEQFSQATSAYATATLLCPQDAQVWLKWAQFLLKSARRSGDIKRLRLSLEKCHHAYACDGKNPQILATWAEGLALLGQITDRLDLIYEAENKLAEALEHEEEDPALWQSFGMCMNSFALYFNDPEHYYLAIEKFQTGLSIDRTYDPLWHEMANTYAAVGALEGGVENLIQALRFYEKALHYQRTSTRHIDYAKTLAKIGELTQQPSSLERALYQFEVGLSMQKNAIYLHPDWLFHYGVTLDMMGDYHDDEKYYTKAIEILSHVIMLDPNFSGAHHCLAQAYSHLGELTHESDYFYRAIHHLKITLKREEDSDALYLDWGIALINLVEHAPAFADMDGLLADAKEKLTESAKLGNPCAYYQLSCLFSITHQYEQSLFFLQKAEAFHALPPMEELLCDDWLNNLRTTSEFHQFLAQHPHLSEER